MTYQEAMRWVLRAGVEVGEPVGDAPGNVVLKGPGVAVTAVLDTATPEGWEKSFVAMISRFVAQVENGTKPSIAMWRDEMPTVPRLRSASVGTAHGDNSARDSRTEPATTLAGQPASRAFFRPRNRMPRGMPIRSEGTSWRTRTTVVSFGTSS